MTFQSIISAVTGVNVRTVRQKPCLKKNAFAAKKSIVLGGWWAKLI